MLGFGCKGGVAALDAKGEYFLCQALELLTVLKAETHWPHQSPHQQSFSDKLA